MRFLWDSVIGIKPDLPFLYSHTAFTNERISVYLDKHNHMSLDTKITVLNKCMVPQIIYFISAPICYNACSCDKVYHTQEVRFLLYIVGQIVT